VEITIGAAEDPVIRLIADRTRARAQQDPCANLCTLANVDEDGLPRARTMVLREIDARLAIFVNATSPKWPTICSGNVSIVVWLPTLNVQYRLACETEPVPEALVAASWQLRPDPPKQMDWFYTRIQPQSSNVASRHELLDKLASLDLPDPLLAPDTAKGLFLNPTTIDRLDLGQTNGIHDRRCYQRNKPGWTETVLAP